MGRPSLGELDGRSSESLVEPVFLRNDLADVSEPAKQAFVAGPAGLGGGREKDGRAKPVRQALEHVAGGRDEPVGHRLAFIENDDASRDVVEFAAPNGLVREQALEELDACGDDHGGGPIFRAAVQPLVGIFARGFRFRRIGEAVMLEDQTVGAVAQRLADRTGVLLDNAQVRRDVDDAPQAVKMGVLQGEGDGRQGLASSGRD
jgi:hypothetical protein